MNKDQIKKYKKEFELLQKTYKKTSLKYKFVISIDIPKHKFNDKELSEFQFIYNNADFVMIYSYSNDMLMQLSSKKYCHMIINVFSQEVTKRFDFIHHFNSGINHIILAELNQRSISLGVDISCFSNTSSLRFAKYLSSCIQNSELSTKAKVPHICFSIIHSIQDVRSEKNFTLIQKALFNATPKQIQYQKSYLDNFFDEQDRIRSGKLVK